MAAATAGKLQHLRASIGQVARDQGVQLEEETKRLVEKIRETDRTAAQDTNRLKSLEDKLRHVPQSSYGLSVDNNSMDIHAVERMVADFRDETCTKGKRKDSEEL